MTVREYLQRKGINYKEIHNASGSQAIFPCPNCGDATKFGINLDTGAYQCMRANSCGFRGSFTDFQRFYRDEPVYIENKLYSEKKTYSKPKEINAPINEVIYKWFEKRKIQPENVDKFNIGYIGNEILFQYHKNGELVNIKYRDMKEKKFRKETGCMSTLWNQDYIEGNKLIIVEGEIDCMSLYEYGLEGVSVPSGVNDMTWIENDWEYLDRFSEIFIVMDNDSAGQSSVEKLVNRLGKWRCKNVVLPMKDVNECLMNNIPAEQIKKCFAEAKEFNIETLKSVTDFTEKLIEYKKDYNKLYGITTGNVKLTEIMKGWRLGEVSIWTGQNGSGKSTFLSQEMIHILEQGKSVCIGSFEMDAVKYLWWFCKQALSKPDAKDEEIRNLLRKYSNQLYIIDIVGNIQKAILFDIMEFAYRKYGVEYFMIDSFVKVRLTNDSTKIYGEQQQFMDECTAFVKKYKSHLHFVFHPRKQDDDNSYVGKNDVKGDSSITDLADNVFSLHRFTEEQRQMRRTNGKKDIDAKLRVLKNREHGQTGDIDLYFNVNTKKFFTEYILDANSIPDNREDLIERNLPI